MDGKLVREGCGGVVGLLRASVELLLSYYLLVVLPLKVNYESACNPRVTVLFFSHQSGVMLCL